MVTPLIVSHRMEHGETRQEDCFTGDLLSQKDDEQNVVQALLF